MSDYNQFKRREQQAYEAEFEAFFAAQTPEEQDRLRRLGLDKPVRDSRSYVTGHDHDAGEDANAEPLDDRGDDDVFEVDQIELIGRVEAAIDAELPMPTSIRPAENSDEKVQDAIRLIVSGLTSSQNIRVDAIALAFAAGLSICSIWGSQSEASRHFGIMRQHLNKAVRKWRDLLSLPQNPYTSSEARRKKLSKAQKTKHWRKKNTPTLSL